MFDALKGWRFSKLQPLVDMHGRKFGAVLADPPWRFLNRTGKVAPEHRRLQRYRTLDFQEIADLPVGQIVTPTAHLYLWCPNALLPEGLATLKPAFSTKAR